MRIRITSGGIFGNPTPRNPTGEIPIGTEFKVDHVPAGWAGRYVDLDDVQPEGGEDVGALKARIIELEGIVADRDAEIIKLNGDKTAFSVKEQSPGWFAVVDADGKPVTKNLRQDDVKDFEGLSNTDKAAFVDLHKAS